MIKDSLHLSDHLFLCVFEVTESSSEYRPESSCLILSLEEKDDIDENNKRGSYREDLAEELRGSEEDETDSPAGQKTDSRRNYELVRAREKNKYDTELSDSCDEDDYHSADDVTKKTGKFYMKKKEQNSVSYMTKASVRLQLDLLQYEQNVGKRGLYDITLLHRSILEVLREAGMKLGAGFMYQETMKNYVNFLEKVHHYKLVQHQKMAEDRERGCFNPENHRGDLLPVQVDGIFALFEMLLTELSKCEPATSDSYPEKIPLPEELEGAEDIPPSAIEVTKRFLERLESMNICSQRQIQAVPDATNEIMVGLIDCAKQARLSILDVAL
ncbi:hypothetical protein CI610_01139 [invertebrate metagenome]|uniref:Uncharacterized protein n=1 Tax=invertebrate metagenome TaxID=1711999 RepID=A0A2H9T9J1_9ZZZZ